MPEDPELERRLEAMFASARPRAGFEDQLWKQLQARRPWPRRLLEWLVVPAHLTPALAALVVVAGVGWLATSFHPAGNTTTSGNFAAPSRATAPAFGLLPPLSSAGKGAANAVSPAMPAPGVSGGPALPTASGSDAAQAATGELPVYRFDQPSASALAAAATALTDSSGLPVQVLPGDPATGRAPSFQLTGLSVTVGPEGQAAAAQDFLGHHNLLPQYSYQVLVGSDRVVYNRQFLGGSSGSIPDVTPDGRPAGLEVVFSGGELVSVSGPLELALASSPYPTRSLTSSAAYLSGASRLVYVLVVAGGHGYYEPEVRASGPAGYQFEPVIAPQYLSRT
jgi:hypothetical protein